MSLTKVTYSMIAGARLNVLDFGADNTGGNTAATTAAIQAAITAGISQKKAVFFPSGVYSYASASTFNITTQNAASLHLYGDPYGDTRIELNADGHIFTVASGENGSGPSYKFNVSDINFRVINTGVNTNATIFYIERPTLDWGAHFHFEDCFFESFTNCAIHAIRCFNSGAYRCTFQGTSLNYSQSNGTVGLHDAGIRVWGANGTTTLQEHNFSNLFTLDTCVFRDIQLSTDFWNIQGNITNCTFDGVWVGICVRQTPNGNTLGGTISSLEKGGYQMCILSVDNCWFEQIYLYPYVNNDVNVVTGAVTVTTPSGPAYINYQSERNYITTSALPYPVKTPVSYNGPLNATQLSTDAGQVTSPTVFTWTKLFTPAVAGVYQMIARIYFADAAAYSAVATVFNDGNGKVVILGKAVGTGIDLRVTLLDVEVYQNLSTPATIDYAITRML